MDTITRKLHKKSKEGLIKTTRNVSGKIMIYRKTVTRIQKWEDKQLYGKFKRHTSEFSNEKTLLWLRKGNLKGETESLQNKTTLMTNYVKAKIDKTQKIAIKMQQIRG